MLRFEIDVTLRECMGQGHIDRPEDPHADAGGGDGLDVRQHRFRRRVAEFEQVVERLPVPSRPPQGSIDFFVSTEALACIAVKDNVARATYIYTPASSPFVLEPCVGTDDLQHLWLVQVRLHVVLSTRISQVLQSADIYIIYVELRLRSKLK